MAGRRRAGPRARRARGADHEPGQGPVRACAARRSSTWSATTRRSPSRSCARWAAGRCSCSASRRAPAAVVLPEARAVERARLARDDDRPDRQRHALARARGGRRRARRVGGEPRVPRLPRLALPRRRPRARRRAAPRPRPAAGHRVRARRARPPGSSRRCSTSSASPAIPKTTGNRGLHVYVRLEPRWDSYEVRSAAVAAARELERRRPDILTAAWWKEERGERIFVDYNQNAPHKTVFGAWSVRARRARRSRRRSPGTSSTTSTRTS